MLNTVLTVQAHKANSHRKKGWEPFTEAAIRALNANQEHVVFILWGKPAQVCVQVAHARVFGDNPFFGMA